MKKLCRILIVLTVCILAVQTACLGSYFQMKARSNICSPSTFAVNARLTDKASLQGKWRVDLAVYVDKELVRKESSLISRKGAAVFKVDFPELRKVVNGRYRAELYLDGEFIEGVEKKFSIWPRSVPYKLADKQMVIWAYDKSGSLQKIFKSIGVKVVDATFQTARDFSKPDIIFVGENTEPKDMKVLDRHLMVSGNKPVLVSLSQKDFAKTDMLQICKPSRNTEVVSSQKDADILKGLGKFDVLNFIANARPVYFSNGLKANKTRASLWISKVSAEDQKAKSYAGMITERGYKTIFCQLPVMKGFAEDPAARKLFFNLLDLAAMHAAPDATNNIDSIIGKIDKDNKKGKERS